MNLLIYGEYFLPVVGGVQTVLKHLAQGLAEFGAPQTGEAVGPIHVTLVTTTPANGMDDSAWPYRIVRRPGFWQLVGLIRRADVIHLAGPCLLPMALAWLMRKPAVVEHHGYQAICPNGLLFLQPSHAVCPGYFAARRYRECLRCCSQTMGWAGGLRSLLFTFPRRWLCARVGTNAMVTNHVGTRLKLPRSKTIYHGIEDTGVTRNSTSLHRGALVVAYVGRLVSEKGLVLLLDAAKHLRDQGIAFQLFFIGDGPERNQLESRTQSLGLGGSVTFTGDLRGAALENAVAKVAVVVMPSVWEETAGLSAIEQMMRGRVVIAADIGGLGEVVGDAGLKFPPGDARALASCIEQVIADPSLVTALGAAARARAIAFFTQDVMIRQHLSLYRKVSLHRERSSAGKFSAGNG